MDINQQLQPIVAGLIDNLRENIESEIRSQITSEVVNSIANAELTSVINDITAKQLSDKLYKYNIEAITQEKLSTIVSQITTQIERSLTQSANKQITAEISQQVAQINIQQVIDTIVERKLSSAINVGSFPANSIAASSINFAGWTTSGNKIKGGIIENFGSTGIEDRATFVQLTLMDHACVFEGPVFAPEAHVKGSLTVDGDINLQGKMTATGTALESIIEHTTSHVKESLNEELFQSYSDVMHKTIQANGLDLDRITQNGRDVVKGSQLGYHIVDTNIQRLGIVKDLQTQGENLLADTLYVSGRRVGVNTVDPSAVFVVWDQEVEMIVAKRKQDTGYIGTTRNQTLVLGSNNKENLTLQPDGSVQVNSILIGQSLQSSAAVTPNYEGSHGQIVWNELPSLGGPIGWVCLGGHRWARFGKIE